MKQGWIDQCAHSQGRHGSPQSGVPLQHQVLFCIYEELLIEQAWKTIHNTREWCKILL